MNSKAKIFWRNGITMVLAWFCAASSSHAYPQKMGDMDEDGTATVLDIIRINGHIAGLNPMPDPLWWFADADFSKLIDTNDVAIVRNAALGIGALPNVPDANNDGLPDHIGNADWDGDGLSNAQEVQAGSNILNPDTDGDGYYDGDEVNQGTSPGNSQSYPFGGAHSAVVSFFNPVISGQGPGGRYAASSVVAFLNLLADGDAFTQRSAASAVASYLNALADSEGNAQTRRDSASALVSYFNAAVEGSQSGTQQQAASALVSFLNASIEGSGSGAQQQAASTVVSYLNAILGQAGLSFTEQASSQPVAFLNAVLGNPTKPNTQTAASPVVSYLNALISEFQSGPRYVASGLVSYANL